MLAGEGEAGDAAAALAAAACAKILAGEVGGGLAADLTGDVGGSDAEDVVVAGNLFVGAAFFGLAFFLMTLFLAGERGVLARFGDLAGFGGCSAGRLRYL